jgi:hypothetical protein
MPIAVASQCALFHELPDTLQQRRSGSADVSASAFQRLCALQSYNTNQRQSAFAKLGAASSCCTSPRNWSLLPELTTVSAVPKMLPNAQQCSSSDQLCSQPRPNPAALKHVETSVRFPIISMSGDSVQAYSSQKKSRVPGRTLPLTTLWSELLLDEERSLKSRKMQTTSRKQTSANIPSPLDADAQYCRSDKLRSRAAVATTNVPSADGSKASPLQRRLRGTLSCGTLDTGFAKMDCSVQTNDLLLRCCVCDDQCEEKNGVACCKEAANGHFFCNQCFSDAVKVQVSGEDKCKFIENNCEVLCAFCEPGVRRVFDMRECMCNLSPNVYHIFLLASAEPHVIKAQNELQSQFTAKEFELREQKKQSDEAIFDDHMHHIAENLVLPRCPICSDPVVDFSNCTHLTVRFLYFKLLLVAACVVPHPSMILLAHTPSSTVRQPCRQVSVEADIRLRATRRLRRAFVCMVHAAISRRQRVHRPHKSVPVESISRKLLSGGV